uniref:TIGR04372 family glycosyltransferase n=1 Tax=Bacteroidota TaxID=976 RepID=UPI0040475335
MLSKEELIVIVRKFPFFIKHTIHFILEKKFRRYHNFFKIPDIYVKWVAPNLAFYVYWIFYPFFYLLRKKNIFILINNISNSPGHVILELDYCLRATKLNNGSNINKYCVIWPRSEVAHGAEVAYGKYFSKFYVSDLLYIFILPFVIRFELLGVDFSLSNQNKSLSNCQNLGFRFLPILKEGQREFDMIFEKICFYYDLWQKTSGFFTMKTDIPMDLVLSEFLGGDSKDYSVIQIKDIAGNGTAEPTDPNSYLDVIGFFQKSGYKVIFAGREKMPDVFKEYGVINYSEWDKSSFLYDLQLIENASIVVSSASGFGNIPAAMEIPVVYTNQWAFNSPASGRFTVTIPALFRNQFNEPWKFVDQIKYFYDRNDSNSAVPKCLNARNAEGIEILEAVKEALDLKNDFKLKSELQCKFQSLFPGTPLAFAESRISQHFIEKFISCI